MVKNREHLNFISVSIDSDNFLMASTLFSGIILIAFYLGMLMFYICSKSTRKQLSLVILCIILSRIIIGAIWIILGIILKFEYFIKICLFYRGDLHFGSFSAFSDSCDFETILQIIFVTFHLSLGVAWLKEIEDVFKNPMISTGRSQLLYILGGGILSIIYGLFIEFLPFSEFERVFLFVF